MAPLPTDTPPVTLVAENGTAAANSQDTPVTAATIPADPYPPLSPTENTLWPSHAARQFEHNTRGDDQTAGLTGGSFAQGGPSLGTRHADGTGDEAAQSETGGFVAIGLVVGAAGVVGAALAGSYAIDAYKARMRNSSAGSEVNEAQTSTASRGSIKDTLSGLCPTNRPKSALPTESGSQQHPQSIELNVMARQDPDGPYAKLGDSPNIAGK